MGKHQLRGSRHDRVQARIVGLTRVSNKSLGPDLWIEWHFCFDPILLMLEGAPLIFSGTLQIRIRRRASS